MKRIAMGAALLVGMVVLTGATGEGRELTFQTGFHYDWWGRDDGSWGQQILVPYSTEGELAGFTLKILGGYVFTSTDLKVAADDFLSVLTFGEKRVRSAVSGVTDTKLNLAYDTGEMFPVGILLAVDFNLPTGETKFRSWQDRFLILDPDLVSVTTLGEGFNVNPSLIVSRDWNEHWTTGVGFGYAWRGDYMAFVFPERFGQGIRRIPDLEKIDPGDVFTVTSEVRYTINDAWQARFYFNCSQFERQKIDGENVFEPGDFYLGGVGLHWDRAPWSSYASVTAIFRGDPKIPSNAGYLGDIRSLTHVYPFAEGDEVVARIGADYKLNDLTTLKSLLSFRYLYDTTPPDTTFDPQYYLSDRKLVSLQVGLGRKLLPQLEAELTLKGLYLHDEERVELRGNVLEQDRDYTGFSAGVMLTGTF